MPKRHPAQSDPWQSADTEWDRTMARIENVCDAPEAQGGTTCPPCPCLSLRDIGAVKNVICINLHGRRIRADRRRGDVCATQFSSTFAGRGPMRTDMPKSGCGAGVSPAVAGASCSRARAGCPRHSGRDARTTILRAQYPCERFRKDVKIVGTNSLNFFRINETFKKQTENELKTSSVLRRKQCNWDAENAKFRVAQTLLLNVCDAPKAQAGQLVLLASACPFGTSQTPGNGVCAIRRPVGVSPANGRTHRDKKASRRMRHPFKSVPT